MEEATDEATRYLMSLTKKIEEKLSRPKLRSYAQLMEDFRVHRIGESELVSCVLPLFEDYEDLHQLFLEVVPYEFLPNDERVEEDEELEDGEIREDDDYSYDYRDNSYHDFKPNPSNPDRTDEIEDGEIREGLDCNSNDDDLNYDHSSGRCIDDCNNECHDDDDSGKEKHSADDKETIRRAADFLNKISGIEPKEEARNGISEKFLGVLMMYKDKLATLQDLTDRVVSIFSGHDHLIEEFIQILFDSDLITLEEAIIAGSGSKLKPIKDTELYQWEQTTPSSRVISIEDIDLYKCEQITPSYRSIPREYRMAVRNPVLNDQAVSVGKINSNEYRRRSMKEQVMIDREDDIFEADMLKSSLEKAIENAKKVLVGKKEIINVEGIFYRCVQQVYGDYGEEIRRLLKNEPMRALPVIKHRLEDKLEGLIMTREHWNKVWKASWEENKPRDCSEVTAKEKNSKEL